MLPARALGPVKELKIVDGFECSVCEYVCGKIVTAQLHGRTHGWQVGKDVMWKSQPVQVFNHAVINVQTFFAAKLIKYFPVDVNTPTDSIMPTIEAILTVAKYKDGERNAAQDVIDTEHKVDNTPW